MHGYRPPEQPHETSRTRFASRSRAIRVVLYMKGTPQFPQCGFSATVAEILKRCGVDDYVAVNVLAGPGDPPGHQGVRELADDSAALRQRRVRRRLRHPARDVPGGRAAAAAREAAGLIRRSLARGRPSRASGEPSPRGSASRGAHTASGDATTVRDSTRGAASRRNARRRHGSVEDEQRHAVHPARRDHGARDARRLRVPRARHGAQEEPGQRAGEDPGRLRRLDGRVLLHRLRDRLRRQLSSPAPRRSRRRAATTSSSSSSCSRSRRRFRRSSPAASPSARRSIRSSPRRSCSSASSIRSSKASRGTSTTASRRGSKRTFGAEFHDFAGSVVVHAIGGWIALVAVLLLGARRGRYSKEGGIAAHPPSSIPFLALGAWVLSVGWFGFNVMSRADASTRSPGSSRSTR